MRVDDRIFRLSLVVSLVLNASIVACAGDLWRSSLNYTAPKPADTHLVRLISPPVEPVVLAKLPTMTHTMVVRAPVPHVHTMAEPVRPVRLTKTLVNKPEPVQVIFHRTRFAFRRPLASAAPSFRLASSPIDAGSGRSGSQTNRAVASPVDQMVNSTEISRQAESVKIAEAIIPQQVAEDTPVITTEDPKALMAVAAPGPTPQAGSNAASLTSSTDGAGVGAGQRSVNGTGAGDGSGNGTGSGNGNGSGTGSGNGSGDGGGGLFGMGNGGAPGVALRHIIYLLDVSPSMQSRIEPARRELRNALATLKPDETFNVIAFSGICRPFQTEMVTADVVHVAAANQFLDEVPLTPGTNLQQAAEEALSIQGANVIVLITDGVPTEGEQNITKLARDIRDHNGAGARIYTIGLVGKNPDGTDDSFEATHLLEQVAQDSGGVFRLASAGVATSGSD